MSSLIDQISNIEVDDCDVSAILGSLECKLKGDNVCSNPDNSFSNTSHDAPLINLNDRNSMPFHNDSVIKREEKKFTMIDPNNKLIPSINETNQELQTNTVQNTQFIVDQKQNIIQKSGLKNPQESLKNFGDSLKDYYRVACKNSQEYGELFLIFLGNLLDEKVNENDFIEKFSILFNPQFTIYFKKMAPELIKALKATGKPNITKMFINSFTTINTSKTGAYKPIVNSNTMSNNLPIAKELVSRPIPINHRQLASNMLPLNPNINNQQFKFISQSSASTFSNMNHAWNAVESNVTSKNTVVNNPLSNSPQTIQSNQQFNKLVSIAPSTINNNSIRHKFSDSIRLVKPNQYIRPEILQNNIINNPISSTKISNQNILSNQMNDVSNITPRHSYRLRQTSVESLNKLRPEFIGSNNTSLCELDSIGFNIKQENIQMNINNYLAISKNNSDFLVNTDLIRQKLINYLNKLHFSIEINPAIIQILSESVECIIKNILVSTALNASHRSDSIRNDFFFETSNDLKSQLSFIDEIENSDKMRKELQKREAMLKVAKSKSRNDSIEHIRLKEQVKQLQQAEEDYLQKQATNSAALAAIGNKKKRKTEINNPFMNKPAVIDPNANINCFQKSSMYEDFGNQSKTLTRITLKDLQCYFESHPRLSNNKILIKSFHK